MIVEHGSPPLALALSVALAPPLTGAGGEATSSHFEGAARSFLGNHCMECHDEEVQKGGVNLGGIGMDFTAGEAGGRWLEILDQLEIGSMPPKDKTQPGHPERMRMIGAIREQFRLAGKPVERLRPGPEYGNYLDHASLFSGEHRGPSYSRPRIWRISPYIDGASSPFTLSQDEGFKDYASMWSVDKPTIELLLLNAKRAVEEQIGPSAAALEAQDERWRQELLNKRRGLQAEIAALDRRLAERPGDEGLTAQRQRLADQLERNETTDFATDRKRPSAKLPGLQKNVFWRIAHAEQNPGQGDLEEAVTRQLKAALRRDPSEADIARMAGRLQESIAAYGNATGLRLTLTSILLMPESIYRMELGLGEALADGRRRLNDAEIAYAIGYALTDSGPDREILADLNAGRLGDAAVIRGHVERIYDAAIMGEGKRKGSAERVLRFFQEYFAYGGATDVFKDGTRHPGHNPRPADLLRDTDMLISHVLGTDREVLAELLTTDIAFMRHVPTRPGWETIGSYNVSEQEVRRDNLVSGDKNQNGQRYVMRLAGQRAGILTQPSWLTAHSTNFDNDPVRRGKWIYEHLLGRVVPDLPITVDATVPEAPDQSLRERFAKTREEYCIRCHGKMNPLGMAFEMYDDVGRYREVELLRDNQSTVPVDASGGIAESGVPGLDGPVDDALELMVKLAGSPHVRQVFVRHAFRYWMGRNETLDDSPTLMAADRAYVESGGSMKALVASLLTSDSFLYRKDDATRVE